MAGTPAVIQLGNETEKPLFFAVGKTVEISAEIEDVVLETGGDVPLFQGPYEVTPKVYGAVTLATKALRMKEDMVVHRIPQYEVSNEAGGKTFIVGDEYYG